MVADAGKGGQYLTGLPLALLTLGLSLATFIEVLDATVTNVAIPAMSGALGMPNRQGTWIISSYSVASAIAVPLTGWLSRRVGEKRLFVSSLVIFTLFSLLCGLTRNFYVLVACRAAQGLFSGPMVPLSQTMLMRAFPPRHRVLALAIWGMTIMVAPVVGPILGGWLVDHYSWPWIFLINLPIGIFSFLVCAGLLRDESKVVRGEPVDLIGLALLVVGVAALQSTLDLGHDLGWFGSTTIMALLAVAAVALTSLLLWEPAERHPIIDLSVFRDSNFTISVMIICLAVAAYSIIAVLVPLWLQTIMDYSATMAGFTNAPIATSAMLVSVVIAAFGARFDPRLLVSFGFVVFAAALWWSSHFTLNMTLLQVLTPGLVKGIGLPCFFIPLSAAILSRVPLDKLAAASGLSNFLRTLFAAFGTAISVTLWDNRAAHHYNALAASVRHASTATAAFLDNLGHIGVPGPQQLGLLDNLVQQQAYMMAMDDAFRFTCWTFLLLAAVVWLTRPKQGASATDGFGH